MKCLNCGNISTSLLCEECRSGEILEKIFREIVYFRQDTCENPYLLEYAVDFDERSALRLIVPEILNLFDGGIANYYLCRYYRLQKDDRFEDSALEYINTHEMDDFHTQTLLYELIDNYLPNNFIKPKKWCEIVAESKDFACELYAVAAKYFSMIGEYDLSDIILKKGIEILENVEVRKLLFFSPEKMSEKFEKQKIDTNRYRTKKPYWPATEERRRAIAMFYDEKGIKYPRIEKRAEKIRENEFEAIKECYDDGMNDYCTFWCSEVFSVSPIKCIYQIGAVKVRNNSVIDTFEAFIRPWDASCNARKMAAKEIGVLLEVIEGAEDVDLVMPKFFEFIEDDVLVSTGALGNQAKLISRAARYTGLRKIDNEFYDILDMAADCSSEFDMENNTREYLISHFSITEGKTALQKALINKELYDILLKYGE